VCVNACARACVCVWVWAHPYPRRNVRALSVGVDGVWLGSQAFSQATAFNVNIGSWNTASVTAMLATLAGATAFNSNIGSWNTARATTMVYMFSQATAFNANIAAWNVLRVSWLASAFDSAAALSSCNKGAVYRHWGATLRAAYPGFSSMCGASCSLTCLIDANIGTAATAWLTSPSTAATTYGPIADWDTSAVTSMSMLFGNRPTFNSDISKWNVASVSNMERVRLDSVYATYSFSYACFPLSFYLSICVCVCVSV
jgi:surface protein